MLTMTKRAIRAALGVRRPTLQELFPEATAAELRRIETVQPYTMTSPEKLWGLMKAVEYVCARGVPGDFVECGVWRGGSAMAAALTFKACAEIRPLWLYDTYEGMSAPTEADKKILADEPASVKFQATKDGEFADWCRASLEDVQANMARTGYTSVRHIKGKVEDTLPTQKPGKIAILRLDTDFYESTKASLEHLWPRLSRGGVLILDDYGSWGGAKAAVDEFFADKPSVLLSRLDSSGRMTVKA